MRLTPIALAISSSFLLSTTAWSAVGGDVGANGQTSVNGSPIDISERVSPGDPGDDGASASGADGSPITGNVVTLTGGVPGQALLITGEAGSPGKSGSTNYGGSGAAGHGGGSIFGGISTGGAGGDSRVSSSNGGAGGRIMGNTISISGTTTLTGAAGGEGGPMFGAGGGAGAGGHGGGSVMGGISTGGAGGYNRTTTTTPSDGGAGGDIADNTINISGSTTLIGATGGEGGASSPLGNGGNGGSGAGGHGGGSIFGGISTGGAGGESNTSSSSGGAGGSIGTSRITLENVTLNGTNAAGGQGGWAGAGGSGAAGHGGGSIFGGISTGGAGGKSVNFTDGGAGGSISGNMINVSGTSTLIGATGGQGGLPGTGGGAGGHGGGSVFGGVSTGGAGGFSQSNVTPTSVDGGAGGDITNNTINISGATTLTGAVGGNGSSNNRGGGGGAGGHGGGSIFGGISTGGAGGYSTSASTPQTSSSADGGAGGNITGHTINISDATLIGAVGGQGGTPPSGGGGAMGYDGGSVFGGISTGGAGGYNAPTAANTIFTANGGNGGSASNNTITLSGTTTISGNVYGGISQGGAKGQIDINGVASNGIDGKGGLTQNNTITLIGDNLIIDGALYGGRSINGNGVDNLDPKYTSFYQGNTLQIQKGRISIKGISNFQNYNWLLPKDEFNNDVIVTITDPNFFVDINNTVHNVDVEATGNTLQAGDQVILIDKVTGSPVGLSRNRTFVEQGFFIVYDAEMKVKTFQGSNALVLNVLGSNDGNPDGKINPDSEAFLKGRVAQLAMVDQGADMMSDGVWSARASLRKENANLFAVFDGGSNRYKTGGGGNIKLHDFKFAVGAAKAFELNGKSVGMAGIFYEHGNGNYDSYSDIGIHGEVRGSGKTRYNGVGALFHMDVADTDISKVKNKPNIFDDKYGLYVHGLLRIGHARVDFHSPDMVNGKGIEASYNTKSRYMTAMIGTGYVLTLDEKQAVDFYGRYTFSRLNEKDVQVIDEQMSVGTAHSHRLRLGARYGYAYSAQVTPYAGLAYERNFNGDVSGSAYGFTIKEKSLKGNTGIVEVGMMVKPKGANDPFSLNLGLQGYTGNRKGVTAAVRARYVF